MAPSGGRQEVTVVSILFTCPWIELTLLSMRTWKDGYSHLRTSQCYRISPRALQGYLLFAIKGRFLLSLEGGLDFSF